MNKDLIYNNIATCCVCISFIFCICFLLLKVPRKDSLKSYRIARKVMALAYFVLGTLNLVELHFVSDNPNIAFSSLVTLIVASFQAILFTYTLLALIDFHFVSKKKLFWETLPVLIFSIVAILTFFVDFDHTYKVVFLAFILNFISQIIRFSLIFFKNYSLYIQKLDNFFSIQESNRLQWVRTAFLSIMVLGIFALFTLYLNDIVLIIFNIISNCFFVYLGIRFLNYVYMIEEIEKAIIFTEKKGSKEERELSFSFDQLEKAIEVWEQKRLFIESNITIDKVASEIKTNRTYLSNYINTYKKMTFNDWINNLRIEEAKTLIMNNPDMPVSQIGVMIGLSDKSNFGRQFLKRTGDSPRSWKSKQFEK